MSFRLLAPSRYTRMHMARHDRSLLEAALVGYHFQVEKIRTAIADIQRRLGDLTPGGVPAPTYKTAGEKKHHISAEGRARIAAAQRKRWAAKKK
jgi:hypothetical protein